MDKNYIIETKNLTKQYGSQKSVADLNIHVQKGRIYGLLGRNGAGKTTTMKMLLGLTKPTSGEVKIWGKSLQGNEKKLLPRIGSLIESPGFYPNLTATENLQIFATLRGIPNRHSIKNTLDLVGLPYKDKKLFSQYSLGMKQRLAIALAVMHDPELLILDEPINGLDPIGIAEVRSFIRELCDTKGKTILISSHMRNIIKTEFLKLKRYSVIKAGIIMTTLSPLLSLFYSTANGGPTWTFDYFMQQVMISNCTLFFPIIIALIAGYIITREYTDDTMKNILTIPIPYKQLLSGKLLILLLLTISFSLIGCVIALVINIIVGFPGVHFGNLLNMFIRVTGANIGIYISVLPIILIFCCSANNFLGGVALAFVYGYFGTFEGTLLNYYPIKASMILVDPTCGAEYGYTYHIFPAFITIVLTFLISMIILANKKKEPGTLTVGKKKKAVRKKGW